MSQLNRSLHVLSGALILTTTLVVSACSDGGRSPASPTAAQATASGNSVSENASKSQGTGTEPAAYNGVICHLVFPGTPSRTSEMVAIWNLGHAVLDTPFDTARPDLYAILPGTMHQEPGFPEFDHDHIVSHAPGDAGYDGTWDLWVVTPGQNFNPATYQAPRSLDAMLTLIRSGVLGEPMGMAAAGFGSDVVLRAPLVCL